MVYDAHSATLAWYIDDSFVGACDGITHMPSELDPNMQDMLVGRSHFSHIPYIDAELDCLRMYNRALRCVRGYVYMISD